MSKINYEDYYVWQEREVRFDISKKEISLRKGEKCLDTINNIEDSKGNNGDVGVMMFTNLRIVWFCVENLKLNLSIGYDCILSSEAKQINSKVSGESMALFIKVKFGNNRFEFVFNAVANSSPQLFNTFTYVIKLYEHTRLYRDVKLKGFLMSEKSVSKLNLEEIFSRVKNTSLITMNKNEEISAGNGELFITNVRIIWFSPSLENYNCSIPWIDIRSIKIKEHNKFGKIINFETNKFFGSQSVSIKLNVNDSSFDKILDEILTKHVKYLDDPILGVWVERDSKGKIIDKIEETKNSENTNTTETKLNSDNKETTNTKSSENNIINNSTSININKQIEEKQNRIYSKLMREFPDDLEIIETNFFNEQQAMQVYLSNKNEKTSTIRDIIYRPELGLACERLPKNITLESIWKIDS